MSRFNKKSLQGLIKFFFEEAEGFIERFEEHRSGSDTGSTAKPDQQPDAGSAKTDQQPAAIEDSLEPVKSTDSGVQVEPADSAPVGANTASTPDSDTDSEKTPDIKSTDGIGPDINVSDAVATGPDASKDDGKDITQSDAVQTDKINPPTPMGAQAEQSVNGPVQDGSDKSAGQPDGEQLKPEDQKPAETDHVDNVSLESQPKAEPIPQPETDTPKADTAVEPTDKPFEPDDTAPVLSPLQPSNDSKNIPSLDVEKKDDSSEKTE